MIRAMVQVAVPVSMIMLLLSGSGDGGREDDGSKVRSAGRRWFREGGVTAKAMMGRGGGEKVRMTMGVIVRVLVGGAVQAMMGQQRGRRCTFRSSLYNLTRYLTSSLHAGIQTRTSARGPWHINGTSDLSITASSTVLPARKDV